MPAERAQPLDKAAGEGQKQKNTNASGAKRPENLQTVLRVFLKRKANERSTVLLLNEQGQDQAIDIFKGVTAESSLDAKIVKIKKREVTPVLLYNMQRNSFKVDN